MYKCCHLPMLIHYAASLMTTKCQASARKRKTTRGRWIERERRLTLDCLARQVTELCQLVFGCS